MSDLYEHYVQSLKWTDEQIRNCFNGYLSALPIFTCPICSKPTIFKEGCIEHENDPQEAA